MTERTSQPPHAATPSASPSFLDDPTLARAPFAVFVWDEDLDGFVWANGAGLNRWGALSLASFRASRLDRAMPAMAKLRDLSRMALPIEGLIQTLTFWTPRGACRMTCRCRPLDLSDGGHGLVLEAVDERETQDGHDTAGDLPQAQPEDRTTAGRGEGHVNGRYAHLPFECSARNDSRSRPDQTPTHIPGFLSGVDQTERVDTTALNGQATAALPSPSEDDRFAMQEIARMLGRDASGNLRQPTTQDMREVPVVHSPVAPVLANGRDRTYETEEDSGASLRGAAHPERDSEPQSAASRLPVETSSPHTAPGHQFDMLNHELRTPLNSIIGFAEMMQREQLGPIGNARYREYAGDILESARHALGLINDLLDASRVRAGHLDVAAEEIDVPTLLDRVIALMEPQAQTASVKVVRGYPPNLPTLHADARALRQILLNVLTNAFKFTPAGGHVFVSAREDDAHLVLDIRDTGIGMSETQLEDALKPWVRNNGDAVFPSAPVGSGLGLPLVQALTKAQNGELSLTSAPNEGTCVTVRFPLT